MSLIEQAAKRLAELERAGVAVPWSAARVSRDATLGAAPLPARASEAVHAGAARAVGVAAPALPAASPTLVAASIIEVAAPAPLQTITRRAPGVEVNLDLERLHQAGYLVPDQVRSSLAEQFRHLKRPLLKNAAVMAGDPKQRGALIMVTSALPGEGKTFCAINLAVSLAMEVDTAVILVDADVVRPSVFSRLGLDTRPPGLMDLLTRDDLQLQDALVATNIP